MYRTIIWIFTYVHTYYVYDMYTLAYIYIYLMFIYIYIHVHTYRFIRIYRYTVYIVHLDEYGQHLSFEAMVLLTWMRDYTALRMHSLATAPRNSRNPGEQGEDKIHVFFSLCDDS